MSEIGMQDVYDLTQRLNRKLDAYTQPHPVIVPQPCTQQAETVADVAGTYCRMAGDLAAMVDAEAQRSEQAHAVISTALRDLETALRDLIEVAL